MLTTRLMVQMKSSVVCCKRFLALIFYLWAFVFFAQGQSFALDRDAYCSGVYNCLAEKPDACTDSLCGKDPDIKYNAKFCEIFQVLKKQGLSTDTSWGRRIYSYLSGKHRVAYEVEGELPLSSSVMVYLLDNLPFSAHLVNAYQGTSFSVEYTQGDKKKFRGDNGRNMSGVFNVILKDPTRLKSVYFGHGSAKVLMWKLWGVALILVDIETVSRDRINYRIHCIVFPGSGFVKSVMNFVLFRSVVLNIIEEVIESVQASAEAFCKGNVEPIEKSPLLNTPEGRKKIEAFREVIRDSGLDYQGMSKK